MRSPRSRASTSSGARGRAPERVEHLAPPRSCARHARRELAADRLYLGKLGHSLSARPVARSLRSTALRARVRPEVRVLQVLLERCV